MNKRLSTIVIILLLLVFTGYIVIDLTLRKEVPVNNPALSEPSAIADQWVVSEVFDPARGQLNAVSVSENGAIILGGEPFVTCYSPDFNLKWEYRTTMPVTATATSGNLVLAAVQGVILVLNMEGVKIEEWGPFEDNSMITSIAASDKYVAFADAANKTVFVLDRKGVVKSLIGKSEEPFVIPSGYFDIALNSESVLYTANTGYRRIEERTIEGKITNVYGEPGNGPEGFCGCCNPANFTLIPSGFVTAEKGINRIKIIDKKGKLLELVSSVNKFVPALPLDIDASADGEIIYGANPADSKLYVFKRKHPPASLKGG